MTTQNRRRIGRAHTLFVLIVGVLFGSVGFAAHDIRFNDDEEWIEGDFDLGSHDGLRHPSGSQGPFAYQQQFEFFLHDHHNANLDAGDQRANRLFLLADYYVRGVFRYSPTFELHGTLNLQALQLEFRDGPKVSDTAARIESLYGLWTVAGSQAKIGVGRQYISDEREWLFDADIDGVSYEWRGPDNAFSAFVGREEIFVADLLGERNRENPNIFYARYYWRLSDSAQASIFAALIDDRGFGNDETALFLGTRALGTWNDGIEAWSEAAIVTGKNGERDRFGFGFDVGVQKTFTNSSLKPSVTLGLAYGSGDNGAGTDSSFRQTGLQGNSEEFDAVVTFDYYGHVFDPELSNMIISTVGVGMRPAKKWSLNLLMNNYWQAKPSAEIRSADVLAAPNGVDRYLGRGFDIVLGLRQWKNVSIRAVLGTFKPSQAFAPNTGSGRHGELLFKWRF